MAPERIEIKAIRTTGDKIQDRPLADAGGKGLFTKEIEEALLAGAIDIAVHSSKDLAGLFAGRAYAVGISAARGRTRRFDRPQSQKPARTAAGRAWSAPSSPRRQALLKRVAARSRIAPMRGNVETRLRKIEAGEADATLLAVGGLKRLGLLAAATPCSRSRSSCRRSARARSGIETRADDDKTRALVAAIDDPDTATALTAERAFLAALDGSCRTPIAGHAQIKDDTVRFHGLIVKTDGSEALEVFAEGRRADAAALGADAGHEFKARAGAGFFVRGLSFADPADAAATRRRSSPPRRLRARGHERDRRAAPRNGASI